MFVSVQLLSYHNWLAELPSKWQALQLVYRNIAEETGNIEDSNKIMVQNNKGLYKHFSWQVPIFQIQLGPCK